MIRRSRIHLIYQATGAPTLEKNATIVKTVINHLASRLDWPPTFESTLARGHTNVIPVTKLSNIHPICLATKNLTRMSVDTNVKTARSLSTSHLGSWLTIKSTQTNDRTSVVFAKKPSSIRPTYRHTGRSILMANCIIVSSAKNGLTNLKYLLTRESIWYKNHMQCGL